MNNLPNLNKLFYGKNILILDLETTGFSTEKEFFNGNGYKKYTDNDNYKNARIIQIGWKFIENWNGWFDSSNILSCYRKDKEINSITNTHIHGITLECVNSYGWTLKEILELGGFKETIENADYIVTHNTRFDIPILLNELYRNGYTNTENKILNLLKRNCVICTMPYGKAVCKGSYRLGNFYEHYYDKKPLNTHTADGDVKILLDILNKIIDDPLLCK